MLLNHEWVINEIKEEIRRYLETDENENTTTQKLWYTVKAVLTGKFIAIQAYLKKQDNNQINNLTLQLKELEQEQQTNPKVKKRKDIIKFRAEINEIESRETIQKIDDTKSWFFEEINNIESGLKQMKWK